MNVKRIVSTCLGLFVVSTQAFAADIPDTGSAGWAGWYLGLSAVKFGKKYDDANSAYHVLGGYAFNKHVAFEAGYIGISGGGTGQIRVVGTLPVNDQFFVNAKLGTLVRDHETPRDINLGLGLGYNLNQSTSLRADWDRRHHKGKAVEGDFYSLGVVFKF